jgi:hypothetical protein
MGRAKFKDSIVDTMGLAFDTISRAKFNDSTAGTTGRAKFKDSNVDTTGREKFRLDG